MFPAHWPGAILSPAAHATCVCHFSPTIRWQKKGSRGCGGSSFPRARVTRALVRLFSRLTESPQPRLRSLSPE